MHPNITGISSNVLSASADITLVPAKLHSITIVWGTTVQNVVNIRDGGVAGTIKHVFSRAAVAVAGDASQQFIFPAGLQCSTSLYIEIAAGTGVQYSAVYS